MRQLAYLVFALVMCAAVQAAVLFDDFDDGVIDPAWVFTNANVASYTAQESGSVFAITAIDDVAAAKWTNLYVGQDITPTADFHLDFVQTWDQDDVADNPWAKCWIYSGGALVGYFGIEDYNSGTYGNINLYTAAGGTVVGDELTTGSGVLDWDVDRVGDQMTFTVNGNELATITESRAIDEVFMVFQAKYMYLSPVDFEWANGSPTMGVDLINMVPEPATLLMLSAGGLLLRKRK